MKYILLKNDIVIDILDVLRYVKRQKVNNIIIGCGQTEAEGIIGSDYNTIYSFGLGEYVIKEVADLPEEVKPNLYKYDYETDSFIYRYTLPEAQDLRQSENKKLFNDYLTANPLEWADGKKYGITLEDQSEISLNINQYNELGQPLEWHAIHEENIEWTLEDLTALLKAIADKVYAIYHKMQQYKKQIYSATSIEELNTVIIEY